jgi:hypothetical protein
MKRFSRGLAKAIINSNKQSKSRKNIKQPPAQNIDENGCGYLLLAFLVVAILIFICYAISNFSG